MTTISFKEGEDFFYDEKGLMVLTASYLLKRGFCCGNDCKNCPYEKSIEGETSN